MTAKEVIVSNKISKEEKALSDILEPFIYDTDKKLEELDHKFTQLLQALNRYTKALNKDKP